MTPELQTLVDRIELLERQGRSLRWTAGLAVVIALAAIPAALVSGARTRSLTPPATGRFAVVEANRFVVRDLDSRVAGGMEVDRNGTARLVLGRADDSGVALLEAQRNGVAHLTLTGPDGSILASLVGSRQPGLALGTRPDGPAVTLGVRDDGSGRCALYDGQGKLRFRAP